MAAEATEVVAMFIADDGDDLWIDLMPEGRYVVSAQGWWRAPNDPIWQPPHDANVRARFGDRDGGWR
jgi:hypothetical protein